MCFRPAIGDLMPNQRIADILTEIGASAVNPRVGELIVELGEILAQAVKTEKEHAQEADDRLRTVGILYRRLRAELRKIERSFEEHNHNVGAKLHTFSNRIMAFEQQLYELTEFVKPDDEDITRVKIVGDDREGFDDATFSDDDTTAT